MNNNDAGKAETDTLKGASAPIVDNCSNSESTRQSKQRVYEVELRTFGGASIARSLYGPLVEMETRACEAAYG